MNLSPRLGRQGEKSSYAPRLGESSSVARAFGLPDSDRYSAWICWVSRSGMTCTRIGGWRRGG
jgi:hypothetical protein